MEAATAGTSDAAQDDSTVATEHPGPRQPAAVQREELGAPTMVASSGSQWPSLPAGLGQKLQAVTGDDMPMATSAPEQQPEQVPASQAPEQQSEEAPKQQGPESVAAPAKPGSSDPVASATSASVLTSRAMARQSSRRLNKAASNVSSLLSFSSAGSAGSAGSAMRWAAGKLGATSLAPRRWGPRGPTADAPRKPREPEQGGKLPGAETDEEPMSAALTKDSNTDVRNSNTDVRSPKSILQRAASKRSLGSSVAFDAGEAQSRAQNRWAKIRSNTNNLDALHGKSAEIKAVTDSLNKAAELGAMFAAESECPTPKMSRLRRSTSSASLKSKASTVSKGISEVSNTTGPNQLNDEPEHRISAGSGLSLKRSQSKISIQSGLSRRSNISNSLKAVAEAPHLIEVDEDTDGDDPQKSESFSPMLKSPLGALISVVQNQTVQKPGRLQSRLSGLAWLALRVSAIVLPLASLLADIMLNGTQLGDTLARGCSAAASLAVLLLILLVSKRGPKWQSEDSWGPAEEFSLDFNGNHDLDKSSILQQQTELLTTAASQLQEVEKDLQLQDSLRQEQESLLRGFNKIVTQEKQCSVAVIIIESCEDTRQAHMELCRLLHYRCEAFDSLEAARTKLAEAAPSACTRSVTSAADILKDRPKLTRDWRSRVFFQNSGMDELELWARVVLVGASSLPEQLPEQFLDDSNAFVALTCEVSELDKMANQRFSVSGKEVREHLRQRGIGECLLRPITQEALAAVVMEAIHTRMREEFLLLENIGQGTWGNVFRAKRLRDGAVLALKMVNARSLSRKVRDAIKREVQLVRALRWPTVVFLLDDWVSGKVHCMLFPLLDGGDLRKETQKIASTGQTPPKWAERVTDWYVQTLHGVAYLHWLGVVHIDIKPANLLLANDRRALLISDFGSAMLLPGKGPHPSRRNFVRRVVFTPAYASPEMVLEDRAFAVSDCWSVGATFYEVLTLQSLLPGSEGEPKVLLESLNLDFQEAGGDPDPKNLGPAALTTLRKTVQRHATEGQAAEDLAADVLELLRRDPQQRPSTATLAVRPKTSNRLQAVLTEECALEDQAALLEHFKDFARLCVESEKAAVLDPPPECFEKTPPEAFEKTLSGKGDNGERPLRRSFSTSWVQ